MSIEPTDSANENRDGFRYRLVVRMAAALVAVVAAALSAAIKSYLDAK